MKSPGEYALMWANKHVNNLTWPELIALIRAETHADCPYKGCEFWDEGHNSDDFKSV